MKFNSASVSTRQKKKFFFFCRCRESPTNTGTTTTRTTHTRPLPSPRSDNTASQMRQKIMRQMELNHGRTGGQASRKSKTLNRFYLLFLVARVACEDAMVRLLMAAPNKQKNDHSLFATTKKKKKSCAYVWFFSFVCLLACLVVQKHRTVTNRQIVRLTHSLDAS